MMKAFSWFVLAAFLLFFSHEVYSQLDHRTIRKNNKKYMTFKGKKSNFSKEKRYFSLGFAVSALNYYGDLAPGPGRLSTDLSFTRPAFTLNYSNRLGPRYGITAGFTYGTLRGSDFSSADENDANNGKYRYYRNLSFRNRIKELSAVATYDLFENQATYITRADWTPYVFAGVAVFHHNPQAIAPATGLDGSDLAEAGEWVNLRELGTEGQYSDQLLSTDVNYGIKPYNLIQFAIPMGVGVRFKIHDVVDFSAELGFRYLFTDYIDDVSKNYVDLGVLNSELARALSYRSNELTKPDIAREPLTARNGVTYNLITGYGHEYPTNMRGNKSNKDIFMVTTFRISYIMGKTMHRAKFR
ncbi:MAG: DUF6089 family protein [Cyclobacteriaceae bacterium]